MYKIDEKLKRIVEVNNQPKILYKFIIIPFCGNKNIESSIKYQESINGYIQDISTTKLDSNNNTIYIYRCDTPKYKIT